MSPLPLVWASTEMSALICRDGQVLPRFWYKSNPREKNFNRKYVDKSQEQMSKLCAVKTSNNVIIYIKRDFEERCYLSLWWINRLPVILATSDNLVICLWWQICVWGPTWWIHGCSICGFWSLHEKQKQLIINWVTKLEVFPFMAT